MDSCVHLCKGSGGIFGSLGWLLTAILIATEPLKPRSQFAVRYCDTQMCKLLQLDRLLFLAIGEQALGTGTFFACQH
jgi:hypothetical protein